MVTIVSTCIGISQPWVKFCGLLLFYFNMLCFQDGEAENTSAPEDYRSRITTFIPPAVVDNPEANSVFGQTLYQPENEAPRGATIEAVFVSTICSF